MFGVRLGVVVGNTSISGGSPLLLDLYPSAAAAYSVRKLRTAYSGSAIRVRRTDLTEQNIGFDATGNLDTTALLSFVGTGALDNGFVTTWYDQSGNGNNAVQSTAANQPQIVSSGVVNTQAGLSSGKPCLSFDGSNDFFDLTSLVTTTNYTAFVAAKRLNSGLSGQWLTQKATSTGTRPYAAILYGGTGSAYMSTYNSTTQISASTSSTAYILLTSRWGSTQSIYINNSALTTSSGYDGNSGTGFDVIGRRTAGEYSNVNNTEIVLYASDKLSDVTGISNNINTFYSIY